MQIRGSLSLIAVGLVLAVTGCGRAEEPGPAAEPIAEPSSASSATLGGPGSPAAQAPCDPGGGWPRPKPGCPGDSPETAWLTQDRSEGGLVLEPFHTLSTDAEGAAYAADHGLEFPFANDYYDAPAGAPHPFRLAPATVCTGIIAVDYRDPLEDHVVDCAHLVAVAQRHRLHVAVWRDGPVVVQVSELYRP